VWTVQAVPNAGNIDFTVNLTDDESGILKTVVLYRTLSSNVWTMTTLTFNSGTGLATGSIPDPSETVEYFVQAVDESGNVSLVLDHGLPFRLLSSTSDADQDGVDDASDNCLLIANTDQADFDSDGVGNACDTNADNDPLVDVFDAYPLDSEEWLDLDDDGIADNSDDDTDNDGVLNPTDNCPFIANPGQSDSNNNGVGDVCDPIPPANETPVLDPIPDQVWNRTDAVTFTAVASDADSGDTLLFSLVAEPAGASIDEDSGVFTWMPPQSQEPGIYEFIVCVTDGQSNDCEAVTITINNAAPVLGAISIPVAVVPINTSVSASASFTDAGSQDTHTGVWNWDDGSTSAGTIIESGGNGTVSGTHIYTQAGVYTVTLTVQDNGMAVSNVSSYQYVVVYDPSSGFVTGGGWITSPAGAMPANPTATGKAEFGFQAKYRRGATVPGGNTEFQFQAGQFHFNSTSYQWLVISGPMAQFKGQGVVEGSTHRYGFLLTVIDGQVRGGGGVDKFRLKVWDMDNGNVIVYDNQLGAADTSSPSTVIGGGSIVVHR
jgi:PKD repeat protein